MTCVHDFYDQEKRLRKKIHGNEPSVPPAGACQVTRRTVYNVIKDVATSDADEDKIKKWWKLKKKKDGPWQAFAGCLSWIEVWNFFERKEALTGEKVLTAYSTNIANSPFVKDNILEGDMAFWLPLKASQQVQTLWKGSHHTQLGKLFLEDKGLPRIGSSSHRCWWDCVHLRHKNTFSIVPLAIFNKTWPSFLSCRDLYLD